MLDGTITRERGYRFGNHWHNEKDEAMCVVFRLNIAEHNSKGKKRPR